ncbi:MAG TPA: glycoside hydrolase family 3 N-terminal domain-containing protein [Solirubrobacteraceae bacterium]|nr:glycoside hydrolase family 3 N-terminal domain-containing protein [Solirubrobacteraceae bacterium]
MTERVATAVWSKPRRRFAVCAGVVLFIVAVAVLVGVMSGASSAASGARHPAARAARGSQASASGAGHAAPGHQAGAAGGSRAASGHHAGASGRPVGASGRPAGASHLTPAQIDANVNALLAQMTVAEKFGQLTMAGPNGPNGTPGDLISEAKNGQIGSVLDLTGVSQINQVQQAALQSRLHIPLIFGLDVIHGYRTMFPVPLAESSSWDMAAIENDERISAAEATADGIKWTFNPMVDISRDPRWGRVVEGAGEDPFLGSAVAAAKVEGYQGSNYAAPDRMAATIKHFAAYGAPVAGREYNTVDMSIQQLFNDYLPPYRAAVRAGAATVMSSFNSLNGVPNTANPYTLTTILRDEWGFGGAVVSDYQAVQELENFGYAANGAQAAREALTAGLDIEMAVTLGQSAGQPVYDTFETYGPQLLREGRITMSQVNTAVRHVLTLKYLAGMFSDPYPGSAQRVAHSELTPAHLAAARTMADESMVLLRNQGGALPLNPSTSRIAVVGPFADDPLDQIGDDVPIGYDTNPADLKTTDKIVSVLDGIKSADPSASVQYAQGCDAACTDTSGFGAALSAARSSDVTVIVVGEPASDAGEASSLSDIGLPGQQLALVQAIAALGKPYVVVLMNGRPLTIPWLANNAPALLEAWYPGTEGGNAVADVLFGKYDPSGKLTMSFPIDVGQIPVYYDELPTGRPYDPNSKYTSRYLDIPNAPQYPFGYGLSYTTFSISNLSAPSTVSASHPFTVSATIQNTGSVAGADVVQLYLHESDTSILQPVRKLEGFQRVQLNPGQSKTVTFTLNRQNLGFYNEQGQFTVEPGPFDLWVGDSSLGGQHTTFTLR